MGEIYREEGSGLNAMLRRLDREACGRVTYEGVLAGAKALQAETVAELKLKLGEGATRRGLKGRPRYSGHPAMTEGVRVMKDRGYGEAGVHIMGDFRLKWFEKGTAERYTKGGKAFRGRIEPRGFFRDARSHERKIVGAIEAAIEKRINKILT